MSKLFKLFVKPVNKPGSLRLLPEGKVKLNLTPKYSPDGVLDFDDLADQFHQCVAAQVGPIKPITQVGGQDIKSYLAQVVIEGLIHTVPDVLNAFHDDGEPFRDADGQLHLPLSMQGSGRKLDLVPKITTTSDSVTLTT